MKFCKFDTIYYIAFCFWGTLRFIWELKRKLLKIIGFKPNEEIKNKMSLYEMSVAAGYPIPVESGVEKGG